MGLKAERLEKTVKDEGGYKEKACKNWSFFSQHNL